MVIVQVAGRERKENTMAQKANSLAHTKWMCKYHIVFCPKYRRKAIYNQYREDLGEILRNLCQWKGVEIIEGHLAPDHVHMLLSIPPKISVPGFMGCLKGKSALLMSGKACEPQVSPVHYIDRAQKHLSAHEGRNAMIVQDVCKAVEAGRCPLVLTRLVDHAERLSDALSRRLEPEGVRTFLLVGKDDAKTRRQKLSELSELPQDERFCIVATASYIGEGFDEPRLDTLFLAAPISWGGLLTQDVGRIHRTHEGKHEVEVHDYVDEAIPLCCKQWKSRLKTYAKLGYALAESDDGRAAGHIIQAADSRKLLAEDIRSARSSLFLSAGWLQKKACESALPLLEDAIGRGVKVTVKVPSPQGDGDEILGQFRRLGIKVKCSVEKPVQALVCDGSLVWFGGISPLAYPERDDCSIRLINAELAAELEGDGER